MKIPFDIKYRPQIESGEYKVETRDGRPVRVLCWDRAAKEDQPKDLKLCVLVPEDGGEAIYYYYSDGTKWVKDACFDLFIVTPEEELTEFETRLFEIRHIAKRDMYSEQEWQTLRNESAELLAIARKEFAKEYKGGSEANEKTISAYCSGYETGKAEALKEIEQDPESSYAFKRGVEYGKEEALKDLPRWKTIKKDDNAIIKIPHVGTNILGEKMLYIGENAISISCLMKLPGFNEDKI